MLSAWRATVLAEKDGIDKAKYTKLASRPIWTAFLLEYARMATRMTEQIKVNCDYETLVGHSYRAWGNIANYKISVIENVGGYSKFKVNYSPLGELGIFEVKKGVDGCIVIFSKLSIIDNYDEWLKQATEQVNQMSGNVEDKALRLGQMHIEKMKVDPELKKAKQEAWKDAIDIYKQAIDKLQSENRTVLTFQQIDTIIVTNLDCLDPHKYEVKREDRGQSILYTVSKKSGELVGRYRIEKRPDGNVAYGSIQGDSPEWDLIWEIMLNRTIERENGTMTEAKEEAYQRRQESYLKQIQGNDAAQPASVDPSAAQVGAAKPEKPRKQKNKTPDMPSRKQDAYKWVLAWELIEPKINNDPTLKIEIDELTQYLKSNNLLMKEDTIRKIMARGNAKKIPSRIEFERENQM